MSKLNISVSTSCLRLIALLLLLIIYVSARNIDSLSNYPYENNDEDVKHLLTSDSLFLLKNFNNRPERSTLMSDYDLPYGQFRLLPYKKRTIPIELQKALYAHGIVGRRR